jgi:hypothetical protein
VKTESITMDIMAAISLATKSFELVKVFPASISKPREVSDDSAPHACGPSGRLRVWLAEE